MKSPEVVLSFMPVDKHLRYGQKSKTTSVVLSRGVTCFSAFLQNGIEKFLSNLDFGHPWQLNG